jgi:hypothetical protein
MTELRFGVLEGNIMTRVTKAISYLLEIGEDLLQHPVIYC